MIKDHSDPNASKTANESMTRVDSLAEFILGTNCPSEKNNMSETGNSSA